MTPSEIAEALVNGNIAQARHQIIRGDERWPDPAYTAATRALDVVEAYAELIEHPGQSDDPMRTALARVRRCLEGAP